MDTQVLDFIRDRFNSLETHMTKGFEEVKTNMTESFGEQDKRIKTLEDDKMERRGKLIAYGTVGGIISTITLWLTGKAF